MLSAKVKEQKIPIEKDLQEEIISDMRFAFFHNKFEDYFNYLSGCYMSGREIRERKDFYLSLSTMLLRHLRITPQLLEAYPYFGYIAEDMTNSGEAGVMKAGVDLRDICEDVKAFLDARENKRPSAVKLKPAAPEGSEAFFEKYRGDKKGLFIDELDKNWRFAGDIDRSLAFICELFCMEPAAVEEVTARWFNGKTDFPQMISWFIDDFGFLLREHDENLWIIIFCKLAIEYGYEAPNFYSYQAEAGFKLRDYAHSLELISILEKKYKITSYLEHLKCFSLWKLARDKECFKTIKRRLSDDGRDLLAALLAGDIFLEKNMFENAVKAYSYAYHVEQAADVLYSLARAFHACYFADQTDLCYKKALSLDKNCGKYFKFGVELYVKCDIPGVRAFVDGENIGECPVCIKGIVDGNHVIEWQMPDEKKKRHDVNLSDGCIHKFKYVSEISKIECEQSRDGKITVYREGEALELYDILKDYAIDSLDVLPYPKIDEFLKDEMIESFGV